MNKIRLLLGAFALVAALVGPTALHETAAPAHPAAASNGNLSSRDNCMIALSIMTTDGRLPGTWALYDSGYDFSNWGLTPGLVFYKCQFFSFSWGSANAGIADGDVVYGSPGFWSVGDLHFTFGDRQRFPDFTMQYCAQRNIVPRVAGQQCF